MTATASPELVLSGLPGRDALMNELLELGHAAQRASQPLGVLTLDLDHFKPYQERHGMAEADRVLRQLAAQLQANCPAQARLCHLGSDEFVVLLPDSDIAAAQAVADDLREAAKAALSPYEDPRPLTITVGVASSPATGAWSPRSLLALADARMTFAKRRLHPHHDLSYAGALPSDWHQRLDIPASDWPAIGEP